MLQNVPGILCSVSRTCCGLIVSVDVSDAELLMRLIKEVDIPSQLLQLIDEMLQRPSVTQVRLFATWYR